MSCQMVPNSLDHFALNQMFSDYYSLKKFVTIYLAMSILCILCLLMSALYHQPINGLLQIAIP